MAADSNLQGSIVVLMLYDVAEEITLDELRKLIEGTRLSPPFKHPKPEYVRFERPPVIEPIPPVSLTTGEQFDATLQYYDYGVISLLLRFPFSGSWEELEKLSARWISGPLFEDLSKQIIQRKMERIRSALVKPYANWLGEDYYIFHLHTIPGITSAETLLRDHGQAIAEVVHGEVVPLAGPEMNEALQGYMSYYPNDLIVASWNAAFVFDTEVAAEATIRLLEYANSQLLQFRHYDEMLTRELDVVYRFLAKRRTGWRMRPAAARLRTMLLEVTELTERTNNALKFVGDMFTARLYKLCATKIGVTDYQSLVQEKLRTADELYDFMIEQFHQARGFLLEFIVVLILVIELIFLFRGKTFG
jgi:hypothetical protein